MKTEYFGLKRAYTIFLFIYSTYDSAFSFRFQVQGSLFHIESLYIDCHYSET